MGTQLIIILASLAAFVILGFLLYMDVKRHETKKGSKKKGRTKYMPQVKNPR